MKFFSFSLINFFVRVEIFLVVAFSLYISNGILSHEITNNCSTSLLPEKRADNLILAVSRETYKFTHTWILDNFEPQKRYFQRVSPVFGDEKNRYLWQLTCECGTHLALVLEQVTKYNVISGITFRLKNSSDEMLMAEINGNHQFTEKERIFRKQSIIYLGDLFKKLNVEVLKISVTITLFLENDNALNSGDIKLLRDFKGELKNKASTDVVLKTDDFEIDVHKFVLTARSSVFRQTFANDTLESKEGYVLISDMDPKTLSSMVEYMYTGHFDEMLLNDEVKKLLYAADKYDLPELKEICEKRLSDDVVVSTVVNNLLLADVHDADHLKKAAINVIVENSRLFINATKLEPIAKKSPELLLELLSEFIKMLHANRNPASMI